MRRFTLIAVASLIAIGSTGAQAGPPVLDGKKVKKLSVIFEAKTSATAVDPTPAQVAGCKAPQCARITFVYKPAKGVKSPLTVSERNFYAGLGDEDIYLMQGSKVIASCTGTMSNKRYLSVPASKLKPGTTYDAVMFISHDIGESTSMNVELPGVKAPPQYSLDPNKPFDYSITMCGV